MTAQTAPVIPPRPSKSPNSHAISATSDIPKIPPRPVNRRLERSVSPSRDSYAPSPLNEMPNGPNMSRVGSDHSSLSHRPPSVTIPSLGQEGIEYAELDNLAAEQQHQAALETRNVGSDLKLHAPKPSLPTSSAKAQVQAVTRTDSQQAAAAGFGRSDDDSDRRPRSLYSKNSGSRAQSTASNGTERRSSVTDEHGIPEIGQRVPMYPNAGDVQAPSPSPYIYPGGHGSAASVGSSGSLRTGRSHQRTKSGREPSAPPGSYGLHGHGMPANDKFEKAWYEKHPDELAREEQGQYGPGIGEPRPDWALSSDDLNKIVRSSAAKGSGLGTSPAVTGTPEEELGYIATDEYTSRLSSPPPLAQRDSQPSVKSGLRDMSLPPSEAEPSQRKDSTQSGAGSENGVIHVDDLHHQLHHPDGYSHTPVPEDRSRTPLGEDQEYDEPILAADEVRPDSAFLHPAVSPTIDRRGSAEIERSRTPSAPNSRPGSRPASLHGTVPGLSRFNSHDREDVSTPLEDVEEYEPLFPEEDGRQQRPLSTADRFKRRPDVSKHRFPSEDIWEDTPNSLQLSATVSTPDLPKEESPSTFETPEQEAARKEQTEQIDSHKVASHILEKRNGSPATRPGLVKQRFPSQDIWEDAPDSQQLVATIEPHEEEEAKNAPDVSSKPSIPPRPQKRPQQPPSVDLSRKPPAIPDKPKPQIPVRPAKPVERGSSESLTKVTSAGSNGSTEESKDGAQPVPKAKPAIPVRPGGSKIAALKAGFLSDLNSRLQLGPQAPPKPQEEKEEAPAPKGPLSDARKGRARGPTRRKPATATSTENKLPSIPEIKITATWNVWQTDESGNLVVGEPGVEKHEDTASNAPDASESADTTMAPPIARNTAGEPADPGVQEVKEAPEKTQPEPEVTSTNRVPVYTDVSEPIEPDLPAVGETSVPPASSEEVAAPSTGPAVEPSTHKDEAEAASAALAEVSTDAKSAAVVPDAEQEKPVAAPNNEVEANANE
ncbi:hypothetical protein ANI_1_850024 [Paecilomyces variotii No. 5]|uniref:Altered inheritance of mitochondria protein 21 n=1 Tax=Byssochlamys spectabilis (strain No. 5 / NBRC 109023) TaxID=1356009 RepID=V5I5A0_BYSSN|nr:hypothetical protein ANI_1_850024 [Paecilomyces variotii No. 5]